MASGSSIATRVANGATSLRPCMAAASAKHDSKCIRDARALANRRPLTSAWVTRPPTWSRTAIAYRTTHPSSGTYAAFPRSHRSMMYRCPSPSKRAACRCPLIRPSSKAASRPGSSSRRAWLHRASKTSSEDVVAADSPISGGSSSRPRGQPLRAPGRTRLRPLASHAGKRRARPPAATPCDAPSARSDPAG